MSHWDRIKESVRPFYLRWLYFPLRPDRRPQAFQDCWRYPFDRVTERVRLAASGSGLPDLLFFPMTDWHTRIQRTQHLVSAFAGMGFRCIYINPHLGREFDTAPAFDRAHRLSRIGENIFELHIRLPREPVFHDRLLTAAEETIIAGAIGQVLPQAGNARTAERHSRDICPRVIQILSFPLWLGVARRFRDEAGFPIVYDCHDLLSGFHNICDALLRAEGELLDSSDLVVFSSQGLMDRYPDVRRGLLVRNAVTATSFVSQSHPPAGPPVVGYVGALDSWFDVEAIERSAALNPECRFVLAGRIEFEPIRRLQSLPNVEFMGEIPYTQVPELLAQFRVALIPFQLNPLTLMTNPIKLYEYFSCGLPVVSTPLPEAQAMGDLVYVGASPDEFARQVGLALREDEPARRVRRREIALEENWVSRARAISGEFASLLAREVAAAHPGLSAAEDPQVSP